MKRPKKVLLLGAGGMGMAPLALYLRGAGVRVEAYDDCFTEPGKSYLKEQGVHVLDELNPIKVPDCIVHSSAIPKDNEFLLQFENSEIPTYRRGIFWPSYSRGIELLQWWEATAKPVFRVV